MTLSLLVLNLVFLDPITVQFRRDAVLLELLPLEYDSNSTCTWDVKYDDRDTAGERAEGYVVQSSDYSAHGRMQAGIAWAHYEGFASVTGTAMRIAAANSRIGAANALMNEELNDAVKELAVKLGTHVYNGSAAASPRQIEGVARAVDATGTYAGIDSSTYTWWASGEQTLAAASLNFDNIRTKLFRPFKDAMGKMPEFVVCPGAIFDRVVALFDDQTNIMLETISLGDGQGGIRQIDLKRAGARAVMIDGVPFVEDRFCTANTMYALHTDFLAWRQVPPAWASMDPGQIQQAVEQVTGDKVDINEITAMMAKARKSPTVQINALGKDGDTTKLQVVIDIQLKLKRRNAASKLTLT